jgi:peptidoglycan hydrolase CwlO-like protein
VSDFQELESRVTALEERIGQEAGLRASQDRDLSSVEHTLRAQHLTIQALALTQSEHNFQIQQLDRSVGQLDHKVGQLDHKVGQLDHKVDRLDQKVDRIEAGIEGMNDGLRQVVTLLSRASGGDPPTLA